MRKCFWLTSDLNFYKRKKKRKLTILGHWYSDNGIWLEFCWWNFESGTQLLDILIECEHSYLDITRLSNDQLEQLFTTGHTNVPWKVASCALN